jgi:hypothetical protein
MTKWDSIKTHAGKRKIFDGKWYIILECGHLLCLQLYNSSKIACCPPFFVCGVMSQKNNEYIFSLNIYGNIPSCDLVAMSKIPHAMHIDIT